MTKDETYNRNQPDVKRLFKCLDNIINATCSAIHYAPLLRYVDLLQVLESANVPHQECELL
jgi:hypothetical protein